jgi:hypothetical protein
MEASRLGVFEVSSDGIFFSSLNSGQSLDRKFLIPVRYSACYITEKKGIGASSCFSVSRRFNIFLRLCRIKRLGSPSRQWRRPKGTFPVENNPM